MGCNILGDELQLTRGPELCCDADSGIGSEVETMGGTATRCGLHNGCDLPKKNWN